MLRGREGMGAGQRAGDPTLWGGYRERELGSAPGDTSAPACTPDLPHGNGLPLTEIDFSPTPAATGGREGGIPALPSWSCGGSRSKKGTRGGGGSGLETG